MGKIIKLTETKLNEIVKQCIEKYFNEDKNISFDNKIYGDIPKIKLINYNSKNLIKSILDENIKMSFKPENIRKIVCKKFNLFDKQFQVENVNGVDIVVILLPSIISSNIIGEIKHMMQTFGYFQLNDKIIQNKIITLAFEPRFSKIVTNEIIKKYKYLYHVTPSVYVEKIKNIGICPKSKNSLYSYPDRVYLFTGNELNNEQMQVIDIIKSYREDTIVADKNIDTNEYSILKIDVTKLPLNIDFYYDPLTADAIFTYENIPPTAIVSITKF